MSPSQKLRTIGFNASLSARGVSLSLQPSGVKLKALISSVDPEADQYTFATEERNMAWLSFLRAHLVAASVAPTTGNTFLDVESGTYYRITRDRSQPNDIAARYECEVS